MHLKMSHLYTSAVSLILTLGLSCTESNTKPTQGPEVRTAGEMGGASGGAEDEQGGEISLGGQAGGQAGDQAGSQAGSQAGDEAGSQAGAQTITEGCDVEICDALDNDCDGLVDEGQFCPCNDDQSCYSGAPETRGVGVCADGARECAANGEVWLECVGSITPTEERCDELDNDCDGLVDEMMGQTCGECVADGPEQCDGVDNDCDGVIDEELIRPCPCGKTATQMLTCEGGVWEGCEDEMGRSLNSGMTTIELPAIAPNCPFDMGDNLPEEGGAFSARVEQVVDFTLPDGAQLCAFSLSGSNESFYFDDELMLLMNDVPLISSVNFASQFEVVDELPRYDWQRIRGMSTDDVGEDATCIDGAVECLIPGTQSNGELSIAFDAPTNVRLANTSDQGAYQFKVVITGDNDPDLDCSHSGLTLQVNYEYFTE